MTQTASTTSYIIQDSVLEEISLILSNEKVRDIIYDGCPSDVKADIYAELRKSELRQSTPHYLDKHTHILGRGRIILLDWLIEVVKKFSCDIRTFHCAIKYIDKFLSKMYTYPVVDYQVMGTAALLIASKLEDCLDMDVKDCMTVLPDDPKDLLLETEAKILKELNWDISPVTSTEFLGLFVVTVCIYVEDMLKERDVLMKLSTYCATVALFDYHIAIELLPSQIAATSVFYAIYMIIGCDCWPEVMERISGYSKADVLELSDKLHDALVFYDKSGRNSLFKYFSLKSYLRVASKYPVPKASPSDFVKMLESDEDSDWDLFMDIE